MRPANPAHTTKQGYQHLVALTRLISGRLSQLVALLREPLYYTDLWAAHLLLMHALLDETTTHQCLLIITRYATSPHPTDLTRQQAAWLRRYPHPA